MKQLLAFLLFLLVLFPLCAVGRSEKAAEQDYDGGDTDMSGGRNEAAVGGLSVPDGFVLIAGGSFLMGSPENEAWRGEDELQHPVSVGDFYMGRHELTQDEYRAVMGDNPSTFSGGDLPVENISWFDAVAYCNARSLREGLTPAYVIDGRNVSWDRSANGYRLPTEAEWEYACRAGTATPFNTENSISAEESNYYGHYPYMIEENYFSQENLDTRPGRYRQTTLAVGSFAPNAFGLYDMHGNVGEWVWDYYGTYMMFRQENPAGPVSGASRVYRGGGWNDFAKNLRSAYRATLPAEQRSFNIGLRLVLDVPGASGGIIGSESTGSEHAGTGDVLIAYFSWGGNTEGIAREIQRQSNADLFEITMVQPYSTDYNTVLDEAQRDQNLQARPALASHVGNMDQYDTILLGYPNWWASIPMPVATFLESYDFSGKTIIPFCSHGGGRFGQSLTAVSKLVPEAVMGDALSIHYSGGSTLSRDISRWLERNGISGR